MGGTDFVIDDYAGAVASLGNHSCLSNAEFVTKSLERQRKVGVVFTYMLQKNKAGKEVKPDYGFKEDNDKYNWI